MGPSEMVPPVRIETTTGTTGPKDIEDATLEDLLALSRLPGNLFQAYEIRGNTRRPVPIDRRLGDLGDC